MMTEHLRLRECRDLVYLLIGDLRDLLEDAESEETVHWMTAVLDALLETIPEEYALKSEPDGYLTGVLQDFPNWEAKVLRLEDEYFSLYGRLVGVRRRLRCDEYDHELARQSAVDLQSWMDEFRNYVQEEQQLVLLATNLEVGGGD